MSEPEVHERDYYSVTLDAHKEDSYLFEGIDGDTVIARKWNGHVYDDEMLNIPIDKFVGSAIEIRYYLRQYEFVLKDAREFELASCYKKFQFQVKYDNVLKSIYNKKSLVLRQRYELLKLLVNTSLEDRTAKFSPYSVIVKIYGKGVGRREDAVRVLNHYRYLLEALADEGLLRKHRDSDEYQINPKAITALNTYEDEERRHEDSQKTQRSVKRITYVAAFATVVQGLAAWDEMQATVMHLKIWVVAALALAS
ncbi:hypothetical protein OJJOAM_004725 [Cupriavidus sp. H18C1]|uniref:hypothetical protein n=1 Tax=Cupriavidus sp. H18C1 TaxID=3241601 RepID=UPI003BB85926